MSHMDPMGLVLMVFLGGLLIAAVLGLGADSRDGADGSGFLGRRQHRPWSWW